MRALSLAIEGFEMYNTWVVAFTGVWAFQGWGYHNGHEVDNDQGRFKLILCSSDTEFGCQ